MSSVWSYDERSGSCTMTELTGQLEHLRLQPAELSELAELMGADEAGQIDEAGFAAGLGRLEQLMGLPPVVDVPGALDYSPLGCQPHRIASAEHRAISVKQLQRVRDFISSHASPHGTLPWLDLAPANRSPTSGLRLRANSINLYQLNDWLIKPATEQHKCSLVELLCPEDVQAQPPDWFVSHSWWVAPVACRSAADRVAG